IDCMGKRVTGDESQALRITLSNSGLHRLEIGIGEAVHHREGAEIGCGAVIGGIHDSRQGALVQFPHAVERRAFIGHVGDLEAEILRQLALNSETPLLDIAGLQIPGDELAARLAAERAASGEWVGEAQKLSGAGNGRVAVQVYIRRGKRVEELPVEDRQVVKDTVTRAENCLAVTEYVVGEAEAGRKVRLRGSIESAVG